MLPLRCFKSVPCVIHGRKFETEEQYHQELHEFMDWHVNRPLFIVTNLIMNYTLKQLQDRVNRLVESNKVKTHIVQHGSTLLKDVVTYDDNDEPHYHCTFGSRTR